MEPSFNPALEAQAIGRVHRLGQKRNVEVVRFIMKDSVEPRILKMLKGKYGNSSTDDDDDVIDVGTKKKPAVAALVGSIHTDRTTVLGAEFDILFGVSSADDSTEMMDTEPDAVLSSANGVSSASI
jgi:hypothetical protein